MSTGNELFYFSTEGHRNNVEVKQNLCIAISDLILKSIDGITHVQLVLGDIDQTENTLLA